MPRRRASRTSISSERSTGSEHGENLNISVEFPDAGMPKNKGGNKGGKKKKNASSNLENGKKQNNVKCVDLTETPTPSTSDTLTDNVVVIDEEQQSKKSDDNQVLDLTEEKDKPPAVTAPAKGKKKVSNSKQKVPEVNEITKQKQIEEKDMKVSAHEVNKMYKIGDCIKSMNIELHPRLLAAWYLAELRREAAAAGCAVLAAPDICDVCLVFYTQNTTRGLAAVDGQVRLTPHKKQCGRSLYVMAASEAAQYIQTRTLTEHLKHKREIIGGRLTFVLVDSNQYFQRATKRATQEMNGNVTDFEVEMALTDMLVGLKLETITVHSASELAQYIVHYARAIAEEPYKRAKREIDEQAEFYMRGDNKNCVTVDKDGNGLGRLWQQMLAILPMSSLETARSLTAQYASPRLLADELSTPEGSARVAELAVNRAATETARGRRIGPEFTRKLQMLLTAEDGNLVIE